MASPEMPVKPVTDHESPFLRFCDWVSSAMGSPKNIAVWLILVIGWTALFAFGGPHLASGTWLPKWFASTGYNFPLNLITTVAELFIGFLVAAATNRAERALMQIIDGIRGAVSRLGEVLTAVSKVVARLSDMEEANGRLEAEQLELLKQNTTLTQQVHALVSALAERSTATPITGHAPITGHGSDQSAH